MPELPPEIKKDGLILICFVPKVPIKAVKKSKPPSHWELDLHNIRGSSISLTLCKIEKPVAVTPETASKYESNKLTPYILK